MIAFDQAIELIRSIAAPLGTESAPIGRSAGRVLARPVIAQVDSPRADVSAMDGYAVRDADLATLPLHLTVSGESFAGAGWDGAVSPGTCARIFTGAPIPLGADRVVIQENVRRDREVAIIDRHPGAGRHIRLRGSDFSAGEQLLEPGRLLESRAILAAAAADLREVTVFRRPSISILSTGDELAEPGAARDRPDAIPDSVSFAVAALSEQWGATCTGRTRLRDDLDSMHSAAADAIDMANVVVVTGGASVGEKDFAKAMFDPLGLELLYSKVSIKPGKPTWLGRVNDRFVVGLPGNPTSALVTARLLLVPLLALIQGRPIVAALEWKEARLLSALPACGARETFHRAQLRAGAAEILEFQDSSAQKTLAAADVLVRQAANSSALRPGDQVSIIHF